MHSNRATGRALQAIGAASLLSIILWAGFAIEWWAPTNGDMDGRSFDLFMLHFWGLVGGAIGSIIVAANPPAEGMGFEK